MTTSINSEAHNLPNTQSDGQSNLIYRATFHSLKSLTTKKIALPFKVANRQTDQYIYSRI